MSVNPYDVHESTTDVTPCPACGATPARESARFCATCGRRLEGGYFPTDSLLSSYHRQSPQRRVSGELRAASSVRIVQRETRMSRPSRIGSMPADTVENTAAATAMAFATYALVPYLGILFCPGAVLMGSVGLWRVGRVPRIGGRQTAAASIALGILFLIIHLLLWWILYKIPQWSKV